MDAMRENLEKLRCPEPHNTGFGCCRCDTNDIIDEIIAQRHDQAIRMLRHGASAWRQEIPNDLPWNQFGRRMVADELDRLAHVLEQFQAPPAPTAAPVDTRPAVFPTELL